MYSTLQTQADLSKPPDLQRSLSLQTLESEYVCKRSKLLLERVILERAVKRVDRKTQRKSLQSERSIWEGGPSYAEKAREAWRGGLEKAKKHYKSIEILK